MKNEIKNKEPRERQGYVPASVEVIEFTTQKIICQSPGWPDTDSNPEQTVF